MIKFQSWVGPSDVKRMLDDLQRCRVGVRINRNIGLCSNVTIPGSILQAAFATWPHLAEPVVNGSCLFPIGGHDEYMFRTEADKWSGMSGMLRRDLANHCYHVISYAWEKHNGRA